MMMNTPRLSWNESATGHFNAEQLQQLSKSEPKALIKSLLENNDGPTVVHTMVELMRHGDRGTVLRLHENKALMDLWENDMVPSDMYESLTELTQLFHAHEHETSFREQRR